MYVCIYIYIMMMLIVKIAKEIISDKILKDRTYEIAINPEYD